MSFADSTRNAVPTMGSSIVWLAFLLASGSPADELKTTGPLDLSGAVVIHAKSASKAETKAIQVLIEEVEARSNLRWKTQDHGPLDPTAVNIVLGSVEGLKGLDPTVDRWMSESPAPKVSEGYRVAVEGSTVYVVGNDSRGVLFGAGRLLRELRIGRGKVALPSGFTVATSPRYAIRGHQLGYRPKTHSYDAWDLPQWDRYIRELAVFGSNSVELVPPRTDDDADSPHFPRPPLEMMVGMSRIADSYDMDVWVWYPAMDKDYANPDTVAFAIREWAEVFKALPRIDAIFVPGGDPGHTRPRDLMALLEKQASSLRTYHPKAKMWMSPQSFNGEWFDEFLAIVKKEPDWLGGIVWGPQVRVGLSELRALIPSKYPIRAYPDITHTINCQYPVPNWDLAFAITHDRESINPRPTDQAAILRSYKDQCQGFISYSEGCNDDVNKFVWSGLGWDTSTDVNEILKQFARYFVGAEIDDAFAKGLLALEANWRGPLLTNSQVETTLQQFQDMERDAPPVRLRNWRFQQALFRAYYDAYVRDRLIAETAQEAQALEILRRATALGSLRAMNDAEAVLEKAPRHPVSLDRRNRVFQLAEALFQSIQMQLSVNRYRAIEVGRGTPLDTMDACLNDREYFTTRFEEFRAMPEESARLSGIESLLNRTNPGPGGYYDELGNPARRPHVVTGQSYADDPDFRKSIYTGFDTTPGMPMAWKRNGQTLWDTPLLLRYDQLDRDARYRLRVVYGGEDYRPKVRLDAEGEAIHPLMLKPFPPKPLEFDIPAEATSDGSLTLRFQLEPGRGGNGRGCQVAEVWLMRSR